MGGTLGWWLISRQSKIVVRVSVRGDTGRLYLSDCGDCTAASLSLRPHGQPNRIPFWWPQPRVLRVAPRIGVQSHAVWGFASRCSRVIWLSSPPVFSLESARRPRFSALSGHTTKRDGNDTTQIVPRWARTTANVQSQPVGRFARFSKTYSVTKKNAPGISKPPSHSVNH